MRLLPSVAAAMFASAFLASDAAWAQDQTCRDSYDYIMDKARDEWPYARPMHLSSEWVEYFVLGYNTQPGHGRDLAADTVVVFPVEKDYQFIFAFDRGCMTMYVDLTPNKAYHLIEIGYEIARGG